MLSLIALAAAHRLNAVVILEDNMFRIVLILSALLITSACSTYVQSNPARTATEQLLISTAAERSAAQLAVTLPEGAPVFVDNTNFEGTDSKYAIGTIRTALLQKGVHLVDDKKNADIIIEIRAGALSTDRHTFLIGIPEFNVPVPFASSPLTFPQIALYGTDDQKGVAKFAITSYDAKKGTLVSAQDPQFGFADSQKTTLLIFISWTDNDTLPGSDYQPTATDLSGAPPQPVESTPKQP